MTKPTQRQTPDAIKLFFIASLWFATISGLVQTLVLMTRQYPSNPNMSGFVSWLIMLFVPVLLGFALYLCRQSRTLNVSSLFEVTLLGFVGYLLFNIISMVLPELAPYLPVMQGFTEFLMFYTIMPAVVTLVTMIGVALWLRRKEQW